MPDLPTLAAYGAVILGLAVTPGPNMVHLIGRSVAQGRRAGLVSLAGSALGFLIYLAGAAFGIAALLATLPRALDALRLAGAAYLLFLAWSAVRPGGRSTFQAAGLPPAGRARVFATGLATTLLNPKAALLYLALLPQFVVPGHGGVLAQTLVLGLMHVALNLVLGAVIAATAGGLAAGLARRPAWLRAQRWLMGGLLGAFAARLAVQG